MKIHSFRMHLRGMKRKKGEAIELAAQLAPLEEQDKRVAAELSGGGPSPTNGSTDRDFGAIIVDNDNLTVPKDIVDGQDEKSFLGLEPVVLVVLIIMLCFIAFVTWQISLMPAR